MTRRRYMSEHDLEREADGWEDARDEILAERAAESLAERARKQREYLSGVDRTASRRDGYDPSDPCDDYDREKGIR